MRALYCSCHALATCVLKQAEKVMKAQVAVRLNAYSIVCAHPCQATLTAWVGSDVHKEAFSCE
jgi:hypothetical protein